MKTQPKNKALEFKEELQSLKQENDDLLKENERLSQAKEGISQDYEKLQEECENLRQQNENLSFEVHNGQPKQTYKMLEDQLNERNKELEAAQRELKEYAEANEKLQKDKDYWTKQYVDEKKCHESLSSYAQKLMPS